MSRTSAPAIARSSVSAILSLVLLASALCQAGDHGKLVLVMDDLGNQYWPAVAAIESPWVTTLAILPGRPYSKEIAELAHQQGKEILAHLPMSNTDNLPLGALGLRRESGQQGLIETLQASIAQVPHVVGVSNHMGSLLTQDSEAMGWVMAELKQQRLFFFDSRTTAATVAYLKADEAAVPWAMRHLFLDHHIDPGFMRAQWQQAVARAAAGENIAVIAHPYQQTFKFLAELNTLAEYQNWLVPLSQILHYPQPLNTSAEPLINADTGLVDNIAIH